ncbi:MAG: leucyl aminopeptidase [Gemmatimonadetes bacterium]|jgi:leucyl aminopeptidase|nr:leucyl aminopeptidase [Gemmatimonadota bacterium]
MTISISAGPADLGTLDTPLLVLALPDQAGATTGAPPALESLDMALGGALGRTLRRGDFRGKRDESLHLSGGDAGPQRVLLIGIGTPTERAGAYRRAGALAARQAAKMGVGSMAFGANGLSAREVEALVLGLSAGAWEYTDTKTPPPEAERRAPLTSARVLGSDAAALEQGVAAGVALAEGHGLARTLGMMPGNLCTPEFLAQTGRDIGARHGMNVTVLGRMELEALRMGSFLCVAQGAPQEDPKLIALEHWGGKKGDAPVILVGKGLCFDSGGISIKPAQGMEWMKFDMCGAAGVLGAMETIGRLGLPINVVGLVGSTTNMPSATAVKPGDVVRSMSGKYIEIINTDAEGRLVLADVLSYARQYKPAAVVDAATLTGACVIALGHTATGVMGNDDALVQEVLRAGTTAGEPGWALPMWDDYKELIKSDVADIKNSGGRPAGTISAALFLAEFANEYPWVHLDVAGTAYTESDLGTVPRGPTGVPVGTFVEFVRGRAG